MLIGVLTLALSVAPKDCKADLDCFLATLKTCGPAIYADPELDRSGMGKRMGMVPRGAFEYSVAPGKGGMCSLSTQGRIDSVEFLPNGLAMLNSEVDGGLTDAQLDRERAASLQFARDGASLKVCVMSRDAIQQMLERTMRGGYDSADWTTCKAAGCNEPVAAGQGCSWSTCLDGKRTLSCVEKKKKIACRPWNSWGAQHVGRESMFLRNHFKDATPCVARCLVPNKEATVVCQ